MMSRISRGLKIFGNMYEMKEKGKATFQSYIDLSDDEEEDNDNEEVEEVASAFFKNCVEPRMLQGEKTVAVVESVLMFTPFTNFKKGISGNFFVTNFKVSFVTADKSSYPDGATQDLSQRSKLLDKTDIPLANIDAIYQVGSGTRKKKIPPGSTVTTASKYLEIHCKDYMIHTFGFKFTTDKEQILTVTNALLSRASPGASSAIEDLMFAYKLAESSSGKPMQCQFQNRDDWQKELDRVSCKFWRVADVNEKFQMSTSLPEYFVTPKNLYNAELSKAAAHYPGGRIPTWCYTNSKGASLLRMTPISTDSNMDVEKKFLSAIKESSGGDKDALVMDLAKECPSLADIRSGHDRLKSCIMIDSEKEFHKSDSRWYSNLENCQWLQHISKCLRVSNVVVNYMTDYCQTVILKEESGSDLTCVISSLVQLQMDPWFHTMEGFQTLIEKEWVAMGHQFQKRLRLVTTPDTREGDQVPVFLLFLDCVWQLLDQFPSMFAFTETYLTSLVDTLNIGLFHTFLFNSVKQRVAFADKFPQGGLPSAWDWDFQLSQDQQMLFTNPLYLLRTSFDLDRLVTGAKRALCQSGGTLREDNYAMRLSQPLWVPVDLSSFHGSVVKPEVSSPFIKLWAQCFLRWMVPAQIMGGGNPSQYLQQCILAEEVVFLQHRVARMSNDLQALHEDRDRRDQAGGRGQGNPSPNETPTIRTHSKSSARPHSGLIFGVKGYHRTTGVALNSVHVTSSYPFTPWTSENQHHSLVSGSLSRYLKNTAIDHDYDQDLSD